MTVFRSDAHSEYVLIYVKEHTTNSAASHHNTLPFSPTGLLIFVESF